MGQRSWWWTGKPGVLQSMGSQRVRHDWATELNWQVGHINRKVWEGLDDTAIFFFCNIYESYFQEVFSVSSSNLYRIKMLLLLLSCFSHVQLIETPRTVGCQTPLLMEFFQVRILEWVAIHSSKGSSWPRDRTHVPCGSCIGRQIFLTTEPLGKRYLHSMVLVTIMLQKLHCLQSFCLYSA